MKSRTGERRGDSGNKGGSTAFDQMIGTLMSEADSGGVLDDCMHFDSAAVSRVPLRYRIIALGFVRHLTLEELNDNLKRHGAASLYSRSLWEASLIYAFAKGLPYDEWKKLYGMCADYRSRIKSPYFSGSRTTLSDIKEYLDDNSDRGSGVMTTQHLTRTLDSTLRRLAYEDADFVEYLRHNLTSLSTVREKARYYFCKYLYYYLISCRDRYLTSRGSSCDDGQELSELAVFKGLTQLRRKKLSDDEVRETLDSAAISFGGIFDAFNYFYFGYVSADWMEVLLDYYGDIGSVPEESRAGLAAAIRNYDPKGCRGLTDEEVLSRKQEELEREEAYLDSVYSLDNEDRGYQRNRAGENTIRRYIRGSLDIDRTTLICFLTFFADRSGVPEAAIDRERLSGILRECGFVELAEDDGFDSFIIRFLGSQDPVDFLMDTVTEYALSEENFYLYRMYQASRSAEEDYQKLLK